MKICGACKLPKSLKSFAVKNIKTGLRQSKCKLCARAYAKNTIRHKKNNTLPEMVGAVPYLKTMLMLISRSILVLTVEKKIL